MILVVSSPSVFLGEKKDKWFQAYDDAYKYGRRKKNFERPSSIYLHVLNRYV